MHPGNTVLFQGHNRHATYQQGNSFVETIQLGELAVPFHSEPENSLSAPTNMPSAIQTRHNTVQVPGRFVMDSGTELTRYRQLMKELESIRFVQPMRTPTPEPTARFTSAPARFAGRVLNDYHVVSLSYLVCLYSFIATQSFSVFANCVPLQVYY
jgi:hypothetical protein